MKKGKLAGGLLAVFAFLGMLDSAFVGIKSLSQAILPCTITRGCEEVLNSPYARFAGFSIAWLGLAYYALIGIAGVFTFSGYSRILRLSLVPAILAFLFTLELIYLQAFVIHAFCDYCLLSASMSALILMVHLICRPWKNPNSAVVAKVTS
jgi:uncharacterized membrane protein